MQQKPVITVDGDAGGGQILRNGFSLAALANQPLRVINIRGARNPPGLRTQHLHGIQMVSKLCNGRLEGDRSGSMQCSLWPSDFQAGEFNVDTGTAGSCTLLAQIALPCLLFAPGPSFFRARGGTDVNWSPPIDEMCGVLMPLLTQFGINAELNLVRRGFYPKGGGEIMLKVDQPFIHTALRPISMMEQGLVSRIEGRVFASGEREGRDVIATASAAKTLLFRMLPTVPIEIQEVMENHQTASGFGSAITLVAITDKGCRYGATYFRDPAKSFSADECARKVVEALAAEVRTGACVDTHTQDQLLIFMALAAGRSEVRVGELTDHTKSAITTAETLLPCRFTVTPDGATNVIRCEGVGLVGPGRFTTAPADRLKAVGSTAPAVTPPPAQLPTGASPTPASNGFQFQAPATPSAPSVPFGAPSTPQQATNPFPPAPASPSPPGGFPFQSPAAPPSPFGTPSQPSITAGTPSPAGGGFPFQTPGQGPFGFPAPPTPSSAEQQVQQQQLLQQQQQQQQQFQQQQLQLQQQQQQQQQLQMQQMQQQLLQQQMQQQQQQQQQQQSSPFGPPVTQAAPPPSNPFGSQPVPAVPFVPPTGATPFGAPAAGNPFSASSNPFGPPAASSAASPFGTPPPPSNATSSPFGSGLGSTTTSANPFGVPQHGAGSSPFGGAPAANPFSSQPAASSPFGKTPAPTSSPFGGSGGSGGGAPFGGGSGASSPFGGPPGPSGSAPFGGSSSPFGGTGGSAGNAFSAGGGTSQGQPSAPFGGGRDLSAVFNTPSPFSSAPRPPATPPPLDPSSPFNSAGGAGMPGGGPFQASPFQGASPMPMPPFGGATQNVFQASTGGLWRGGAEGGMETD